MSDTTYTLWTEKYRPKELSNMVLSEFQVNLFTKMIKDQSIPHLLLFGNVGSGKTTMARILIENLDCDYMELNASSDRGIDVVRTKIMQFAMIQSMKPLKVVLLEEFDATTYDFQYSLRNLMETYSDNTRFIMTVNYLNKVIEPIRSRCQLVEFKEFGKPACFKYLSKVLSQEKVEFDKEDLLTIVDMYYPDIRTMLNTLQLNTSGGKLDTSNLKKFLDYSEVVNWIRKGDLKSIRENAYKFNYIDVYRYLFDRVDELELDESAKIKASLTIAEYMSRDGYVADREINISACCLELMTLLGVKS